MTDNTILDKIKKLLAKANNTAVSEQEAQAFNAKAHELMTRYNIDRAMLDEAESKVVRGHMDLEVQRRPWSSNVLAGITKLYYCTWFSTAKGRTDVITIVGETNNLAMCHAICVMVLRSIQQEARRTGGGRSFMNGAGSEVYRRCAEMYAHAHGALTAGTSAPQALLTSADSRALVVLEQKETVGNDDYLRLELKVNLSKPRASKMKALNYDAYHRGVDHGKAQQLRRNLLGNG